MPQPESKILNERAGAESDVDEPGASLVLMSVSKIQVRE